MGMEASLPKLHPACIAENCSADLPAGCAEDLPVLSGDPTSP